MSLRVIFALVCAIGVSAAQAGAAPQQAAAPAPSAPAVSAPQGDQSTPNPSTEGSPAPGKSEQAPAAKTVPPDASPRQAATPGPTEALPPLPDVPPTRKRTAQENPEPNRNAGKSNGGKSAPGKPAPDASPYVIGPLDVLVIKVWGQQNLTGPVDVASDGNISMALIGDVKADGLTKDQLKAEIARRLSDYLNNPEVDVQVVKINSKSYFVYGGVGRAGEFPLIKPTTIMDAMSAVGGFRDFANTKKIYVQRTLPSGEIRKFNFNYKDVSKGKNMEQNIYLQNGDRIFVPE